MTLDELVEYAKKNGISGDTEIIVKSSNGEAKDNLVSARVENGLYEKSSITLQDSFTYGFYNKFVFTKSPHGEGKLLIWG